MLLNAAAIRFPWWPAWEGVYAEFKDIIEVHANTCRLAQEIFF